MERSPPQKPRMEPIVLLALLLLLPSPSISQPPSPCPMDFSVLDKFVAAARSTPSFLPDSDDTRLRCNYALQALHLVQAHFLKTHSLFLPPLSSAAACWRSYQSLLDTLLPSPPFDVLSDYGLRPDWLSEGCMNISSRLQFERLLPPSASSSISLSCSQPLGGSAFSSACTSCSGTLSAVAAAYLPGPNHGNVTLCSNYPFIYAAGVVNSLGPADDNTALCFFLLQSGPPAAAAYGRSLIRGRGMAKKRHGQAAYKAVVKALIELLVEIVIKKWGPYILVLLAGAGAVYLIYRAIKKAVTDQGETAQAAPAGAPPSRGRVIRRSMVELSAAGCLRWALNKEEEDEE